MDATRLTPSFYSDNTLSVAHALIGKVLCTNLGGICRGRIVETEAYRFDDEASHCYRGPTKRNSSMYLVGGHAYIYLIYGMHYCFNVVTEGQDLGCAVLVRAVEPLSGIETMRQRRSVDQFQNIANGPAKLCKAFGITPSLQGENLTESQRIWIEEPSESRSIQIATTTRIGITKAIEKPWRFVLSGSDHVSVPVRSN